MGAQSNKEWVLYCCMPEICLNFQSYRNYSENQRIIGHRLYFIAYVDKKLKAKAKYEEGYT